MSIAGCGEAVEEALEGGNSTQQVQHQLLITQHLVLTVRYFQVPLSAGTRFRMAQCETTFDMTFDVVSNYSEQNGQQKNIHGSHIIKLFETTIQRQMSFLSILAVTDKERAN